MTDIPIGHWIGWSILAAVVLPSLWALFQKGASASRKEHALKTGDASGLTLEDREENRAAFSRELAKPAAAVPGSSMHTAKACAYLGVALVGVGMVIGMIDTRPNSLSSLAICAGLLLAMLGGAVAIGGSK